MSFRNRLAWTSWMLLVMGMLPELASASIQAEIHVGASLLQVDPAVPGDAANANTTFQGFQILFSGDSNSPGGPSDSQLFSSAIYITNTNQLAASITIRLSATDFAFPTVGNVMLLSQIDGITFVDDAAVAASDVRFQTWLGSSNSLYDTSGMTSGLLGPSTFSTSGALPSLQNSVPGTLNAATYSMTQDISFTLTPGTQVSFEARQIVTPVSMVVPEPSSTLVWGMLGSIAIVSTASYRVVGQRRTGRPA